MKRYLIIFLFLTSLHPSQGFYREGVIDPTSPLSVLDPVRRPEVERFVKIQRFFGAVGTRPAEVLYVHPQAFQNLHVFPTSYLTALAWMFFPISPFPTINPNNIGVSDPLGKMTPEQLGRLMVVVAGYTDSGRASDREAELQALYQIFAPDKVARFVASHTEESLQAFYRYALIDGVNRYVHRNISPADEDLHLSPEQQAACVEQPHKLVLAAFDGSASQLLEIPGTEIMREPHETVLTRQELAAALQELPLPVAQRKVFKQFSDQGRVKFRIQATVDMLWQAAQRNPAQTLQLLAYYAWRKFGAERIGDVMVTSGAINETDRPALSQVLANPYTKRDYQELVKRVQASDDIDGLVGSLSEDERNLVLYGGARYAAIRFEEYGNVRVEHGGRALAFANCAEMSLFNLLQLAQLREMDMGLERDPTVLPEGAPVRAFFESLTDEDLGSTNTRNRWTQSIIRLSGVVYRKGGAARTPWEDGQIAHWAELNPGILNQFRALFHLLGQPAEAAVLPYIGSTEASITAAAERLSQLLSRDGDFEISPNSGLKNRKDKADWYGDFKITRSDAPVAVWHVKPDHSFLDLTNKKAAVFPLDRVYKNPRIIGQLSLPHYYSPGSSPYYSPGVEPDHELEQKLLVLSQMQKSLRSHPEALATFFTHANLMDESSRRFWLPAFVDWSNSTDETIPDSLRAEIVAMAHRMLGGMSQIDEGREAWCINSCSFGRFFTDRVTKRFMSLNSNYLSLWDNFIEKDAYWKACMNYSLILNLDSISEANLLSENHCRRLHFSVFTNVQVVIDALQRITFSHLSEVQISLDKDCSEQDVACIVRLLPDSIKEVYWHTPVNLSHFFSLVSNMQNQHAMISMSVGYLYQDQESMSRGFVPSLPPTEQEYVYQSLLPFAQAGLLFETERFNFNTEKDLEPVYARLREVKQHSHSSTSSCIEAERED